MESKPNIVGFIHHVKHPDYRKTLDFIRSNISSKDRVAVESPISLDEIFSIGQSALPQYRFLHSICSTLKEKDAIIIPVEDMTVYNLRASIRKWYRFEEYEKLEGDCKWQKLSIYSSIRLLELAQQNNADFLLTGIMHAYDLKRMGYENVHLITEIPEEIQRKENDWIERHKFSLER